MGKSLIIKGADFSANGMKSYVWDIDFTGNLNSFVQGCGSFESATGTPYLKTLFGSEQTVRYIELGTSCPDMGGQLPASIKVFKINRNTNMATLITEADFTIPSKTSDKKMIIDLGQNITLGVDEAIGFFGIKPTASADGVTTIFGVTINVDIPENNLFFFKSSNLDYSGNSFAVTLDTIKFKAYFNVKLGK